jgi:CheY-like chemotaxis protein
MAIIKSNSDRILWMDDDPKERFIYEKYILTNEDNWEIEWANTVFEGVNALSKTPFKAILLDQMLPPKELSEDAEIWGGYYLLCWLRLNKNQLRSALETHRRLPKWLGDSPSPLESNRDIPVILLSAYHDERVLEETRLMNRKEEKIVYLSKPIEIERVRKHLEEFRK